MERVFQAGKYSLPLGKHTYIMGILNVTPDSFSDGGQYLDPQKASQRALEMQEQGADILDMGGQSTRPGYTALSWEEEWERIATRYLRVQGKLKIPLSVDTFYPQVAARALEAGADIINDVTGFSPEMWRVAEAHPDCGCVVMHWEELPPSADAAKAVHLFSEGKGKRQRPEASRPSGCAWTRGLVLERPMSRICSCWPRYPGRSWKMWPF